MKTTQEQALSRVRVKDLNKSERDRYEVMKLTSTKAEALKAIIEGTGPAYLSKQLAAIAKRFDLTERN